MLKMFVNNAISHASERLFEWYRKFSDGPEEIQDDECLGQPVTSRAQGKIQKIMKLCKIIDVLVLDDRWHGDSKTIPHDELDMTKVCAKIVSKKTHSGTKRQPKKTFVLISYNGSQKNKTQIRWNVMKYGFSSITWKQSVNRCTERPQHIQESENLEWVCQNWRQYRSFYFDIRSVFMKVEPSIRKTMEKSQSSWRSEFGREVQNCGRTFQEFSTWTTPQYRMYWREHISNLWKG